MPKGERKVSRTVTVVQEDFERSSLSRLPPAGAPTYENKLMATSKVARLSAVCEENENKEPPLRPASVKK
jgi:hypothetical protein